MVGRIVASRVGGPEVLSWTDVEVGAPGPQEVRIRHTAIGVNFIDVYFRTGLYPAGPAPFALGMEAAGVVEAVGPDTASFKVGDRVAYASGPLGSYAEARLMPAGRVVLLPPDIDDKTAAGMMLKGMTAEYLLHRTYAVKRGDTVLVHAAAGGVGRILCQWAKHLGATVIGTVGNEDKARLASESGCDHPVFYGREDVAKRVREITGGAGVAVAYDSVGKDTFTASLDSLAPRGMLALYGQSSGSVGPFDPQLLNQKGSVFLTRPSLIHYTGTADDLMLSASRLMKVVETGAVKIHVGQTYALRDVSQAHTDLEARKTTGSTVLLPG